MCFVPSLYMCMLLEISLTFIQCIQWQIQHIFLFHKTFKGFFSCYITQQMHCLVCCHSCSLKLPLLLPALKVSQPAVSLQHLVPGSSSAALQTQKASPKAAELLGAGSVCLQLLLLAQGGV